METVIQIGIPALVGFVLGYFLTTPVIIGVTLIALVFAYIVRPRREQEMGALIGVLVWLTLGIGGVAMWGTHLYVTGNSLGLPNIAHYIIRQ